VSVLLPVRDGAPHLEGALDSLLTQSLRDLEIVAVDDGSTDGSPEILRRYAGTDGRLRVISTEALGIVPALEAARSVARAPYLARMDADDVSHPDRFEAQVDLMEAHPAMALSGVRVQYFPEEEVRDGALRYQDWINASTSHEEIALERFVECPIPHPTFLLRTNWVERVGGYRDEGWPEDYDLLLRLVQAGGRLGRVPEVLLRWRERPDRLSRTHPAYTLDAFRACKVHYLTRGPLAARPPVLVWGAGPVGKAMARALRDRGLHLAAFVDLDPRKIGQEIHGAPVLAPSDLPPPGAAFGLGAVGQAGARAEIRDAFRAAGWVEGEHFLMVA
jgi:cellulose synthase/poly-beta-1,6-N-acetylglucosamine synthase-like glycosyltransferase